MNWGIEESKPWKRLSCDPNLSKDDEVFEKKACVPLKYPGNPVYAVQLGPVFERMCVGL